MPSVYTSAIQDGLVTTLSDYALQCARAFGACISMRDDSMSAPIPDAFAPNTKYYDDKIVEAQQTLAELKALSREEREVRADEDFEVALGTYKNSLAEQASIRQRYETMLAKVQAWDVPQELRGLKTFMGQQLEESIRFDCYAPTKPIKLRSEQWWLRSQERVAGELFYATERRDAEIQKTEEGNKWLQQLREALILEKR